ncbi:MAG: glutaredoxin [Faecousia sp.]
MKLTMYGSHLCQDTLYALVKVKDAGATVEFHNISAVLPDLRTFMTIRETDPVYADVSSLRLGMSLFIYEDGTKTLSLSEVLNRLNHNE